VDCAAAGLLSLVTLLITLSLLTVPMVFHMLINRCVTYLKFIRSSDHVDDQSLSRSSNGFLGSHAAWLCDI
jgi:hypothetical protein